MKKLMFPLFVVSGLLTLIMAVMFIAGVMDFNNGYINALLAGNRLYAQKDFNKALDSYKEGLLEKPEDVRLNNNSGLASYQLNNYTEALEYYNRTSDKPDKFIKTGNSHLKLGDSAGDDNQKLQFYEQALEAYKNGIIKYPQNVDLKYNYEYVKKKLDELAKNNEEQQNNENNEENQDKDNRQDEQQEGQQDNHQDNQQENQQEDQQENQQEGSENKEGEENKEDQGSPQQSPSQSEQNKDQEEDQGSQGDTSSMRDAEETDKGEDNTALIQAQRVLEMLEQQEKESLKNNQEIMKKGKETEHDW